MKFKAFFYFLVPLGLLTAPASASPLSGYWLTEDAAVIVGIDRCGSKEETVCGLIVAFPGAAKVTELAAAQDALCQQPVLWDLKKTEAQAWQIGKIFDPRTERIYKARLDLSGTRLTVRVSTGFPGLGDTLVWTRFTGHVKECRATRNAKSK
ncbi:MAG: DUF2147 domain-containing protein [Novosphingobium sp.]